MAIALIILAVLMVISLFTTWVLLIPFGLLNFIHLPKWLFFAAVLVLLSWFLDD